MRWRFWERDRDRNAVFINQCMDCHLIMSTVAGKERRVVMHWDLCERCRAKRSGFRGAGTAQEMGIE